jgi:hypothetical protein
VASGWPVWGRMIVGVSDVLSNRALNRATLERQLLLERATMPAVDAVSHLVGLQAQVPGDPYIALWSRLEGFTPDDVAQPLVDRKLVRIVAMRATIHLLTADDCLELRPLTQPVLDREIRAHRDFAPALAGVDLAPVLELGREVLGKEPHSGKMLRAALADEFPDLDPTALAYACRCHLPCVQVPPRGIWGRSAQVMVMTAEAWLGRPLSPSPSIDDMVLRYLAAFGPASVADVSTWCRLTGLREVVDRLRPRLRTFRDERGRELVDLPDAPRPDPDTPAPTRFLPEYDNVLLSHDDRSRIVAKDEVVQLYAGTGWRSLGHVLHDGRLRCTWRIDRDEKRDTATLVVHHLGSLPPATRADIAAEGERLLRFTAPDTPTPDIRFTDVA